jgi:tetratricopeptide (TPR) repeat protein
MGILNGSNRVSEVSEPAPKPESAAALALVQEGWNYLRLERPLAAWASWQRALRVSPGDAAATRALGRLTGSAELPAAARAEYRFQAPADPLRRARWDERLRGRGLNDLAAAAEAFSALSSDDPADADALLNLALCHAWSGRNADAIPALDRALVALAESDPERAAGVWTLAEVLRLGAGAEHLADDFRYAWVATFEPAEAPSSDVFEIWPNLVPATMPVDPITGAPRLDDGEVYEWLDRPELPPGTSPPRASYVPRVLATLVRTPKLIRLSSPDPTGFDRLGEPAFTLQGEAFRSARREKRPLPIAWADAALGTFKLPAGLDDATRASLARGVVEHFYEDLWIHIPRLALDGKPPLAASIAACEGDSIARARLAGLIRFREQLGSRPTHAAVYQGYPFDRLRRRLGLIVVTEPSETLDPNDLTCAGGRELDQIAPETLESPRMADALASAVGLGDEERTARFARALAARGPDAYGGIDPTAIFAPLVREALRDNEPEQALEWLARARAGSTGALSRTFAVWTSEVHARTGNPRAALRAYRDLLDRPDADAALALDGALTLLDNNYPDQALPLLLEARSRAAAADDHATLARAERLLRRG